MRRGKDILITILCISCMCRYMHAQEFNGLRTDNYAGSYGMLLNPAMPITGKIPWDVNFVAFGVNEDNNYIKISDPVFKYVTTSDSILDVEYYNPTQIRGHGNVLLQLPSAFIKVDDYAFGMFTNARSAGYFLSDKEPGGVIGLNDLPLYTDLNMPAFNAGILVWSEIGLNAEMTLESNSLFSLHIGANIKYLMGLEALAFENNELFTFVKDTVNFTMTNFNTDFDYTRNLGSNLLYDPSNYALNGSGFGIDLGAYYVIHKKSKFKYSKKLDYTWKFGAALLDFGAIKFQSNSGSYHLEEDQLFSVATLVLDSIDDIDEFNRTGSKTLYDNVDASKDASKFAMYLPASFLLTVDKPLRNDFYVQAMIMRRIPRFSTNLIARSNVFGLTPRYERRKFGFFLPMQLYEDREFRIGTAVRWHFVTVGSDNLRTWFTPKEYSSIDFYVGVKLTPYWLVTQSKKKYLECLKN
ncbi:MAG TPA: DUF5723 family protein [Chitinophagales bacterium]|nr:DUF5723 family protein [Chitinophagales bacterium]HNM07747.1 DUF5723 family protein [Chitinophagales bacterium]HNM29283.1 DUF5723 family protein [Chitinophagales bacterium]